jgi:hypothetical protein
VQATAIWHALTGAQSLELQHDAPGMHVPVQHMPFVQLAAPVHAAATHAPATHASPAGQEPYVHAQAPETHAGVDPLQVAQLVPQCELSSSAKHAAPQVCVPAPQRDPASDAIGTQTPPSSTVPAPQLVEASWPMATQTPPTRLVPAPQVAPASGAGTH